MNLKYATWLFVLLAVFTTRPVLSLGEGDIDIIGADEQWTADTEVPAPLGTSDLNLSTDEPVICHADEVWQGANASPEAMFLDVAFGGDFDLPTDEPIICHADETLTQNSEIFSNGQSQPGENTEIISEDQEWEEDKTITKQTIISAGTKLTIDKGIKITIQNGGGLVINEIWKSKPP